MKNELHPWEVGLAERVKGKEFSFDPQAFADFEELLEAETLGREPGAQAPDASGEVMSAGGSSISLPIVLLAIGLAGLGSWWFLASEPEEPMTEPAVTISTTLPAPPSKVAPAAPPTTSAPIITPVQTEMRELGTASPDLVAPPENDQEVGVEEGESMGFEEAPGEVTPKPARALRATVRLATLPIQPIAPLNAADISLPTVQKPKPYPNKRDRKALFPDVIKKN